MEFFLYFPAGTYNLNQWDKPDKTVHYDASEMVKELKIIGYGSGKGYYRNPGDPDVAYRQIGILNSYLP